MLLLMLPLAAAIEECRGTQSPDEIPCRITATWTYPNACTTYNVQVWSTNGSLVHTTALSEFGATGLCNFTFGNTTVQSYSYNVSSGDTGTIIVRDDEMMIAMIIGLTLVTFIYLYFAFNLMNDHFLLKIILIFFAVMTMMIIPAVIINGVIQTQTTFLKTTVWFFRLFITYFFVYMAYWWFQRNEKMLAVFNKAKEVFKRE